MWTGVFFPAEVMQTECCFAKDGGTFHDLLFVHGVHEPGVQELYATLEPTLQVQLPPLEKCHCLKDFSWPLDFWSQSMLDFAVTNLLEEIEGHLDGVITIVCTTGAKNLVQTAIVEASIRARKISRLICQIIIVNSRTTTSERPDDGRELPTPSLGVSSPSDLLAASRFSRLHMPYDLEDHCIIGRSLEETTISDPFLMDLWHDSLLTRSGTDTIDMQSMDRAIFLSNSANLSLSPQSILGTKGNLGNDGDWILKTPEYQSWMLYEDSFLIWIQGESGMGKSVLALRVLQSLIQNCHSDYVVFFHSCNSVKPGQAPEQSILMSFVHCALAQRPGLLFESRFQAVVRAIEQQELQPANRIQFRAHLQTIFSSIDSRARPFLVIDGLDPNEMLELDIIAALWPFGGKWITPLKPKIMALSRSTRPSLSFDMSALDIDLNSRLTARLSLFQFASRYGSWDLIDATVRSLGVLQVSFLWVILLEVLVRNGSGLEILQRICKTRSATVFTLYEALVWSIKPQHRPLAARVFTWVLYARRPLQWQELLTAMKTAIPSVYLNWTGEDISTLEELLASMAGLLTERNGSVYLIHNTARDFLLSRETNKPWENALFEPFQANETLAMGCLTYLHLRASLINVEFSRSASRKDHLRSSFGSYAEHYWIEHYRAARGRSEYLPGLVNRLLEDSFLQKDSEMQKLLSSTTSENVSLLVCSKLGLFELVKLYLEVGADGANPGGTTPLMLAARSGHTEVVKLLLSKSGSKSESKLHSQKSALRQAAHHGHFDVCRVLMDAYSDCLRSSKLLGELLYSAVVHQRLDMVESLLDAGADTMTSLQPSREIALHVAAGTGFLDGCARLLRCRRLEPLSLLALQIERLDFQPSTKSIPRKHSPSLISEELLRLTSRSNERSEWQCIGTQDQVYIQVTAKDTAGYTPLHAAAAYGNSLICQLLLDCGSDLQAVGLDGQTPAGLARRYGHLALAESLESLKPGAAILNKSVPKDETSSPTCTFFHRQEPVLKPI